jgi:hypothetical protein
LAIVSALQITNDHLDHVQMINRDGRQTWWLTDEDVTHVDKRLVSSYCDALRIGFETLRSHSLIEEQL